MSTNSKSNAKSQRITMPSGRKATVRGVTSIDGTNYVYVKYGKAEAYVQHGMFVGEKAEARAHLKKQGVLVINDRDWATFIDAVDRIKAFGCKALVEQTGWTDPYFALRDGTVFGPPDVPKGIAIFPKVAASNCVKGDLDEWRDLIAVPIAGQHLLMVAVLAALASPMVAIASEKQNFGLELSGPPEMGKTTWLNLFASTAFRPVGIPTFHSTRTGQEDMFGEFRDMPFPVDETNLADPSDKQFVKDFAFRMANGVPKVTRNQPDRAQYRFVFGTTANEPIREALGKLNGDTSGAALQRLLPLRIDGSRAEGVFSFVPERFANPGEFATHLTDAIESQYGTPMRRFLQELVIARAGNPDKLVARIRRKMSDFEDRVGVSGTARGKTRATSAFGLLYAAGCFAKAKGILPESWDCLAACLAAYRNYQACLPDRTPLATRLLTIAQRTETLDIRDGAIPVLSNAQRDHHGAFIKMGKGGRVELLLTDGVQRQFFPDWKPLKQTVDFKALNLSAKDHDGQQRQVRQGKTKERFICFILPPDIVAQLSAKA
ncbi:DUF927 domain-containing protein [Novosphingobium sp. CECT 9465]|uniref:DUF927 domain-containing protein n=1 Tax=Novosphingobium sp. CECT 9465 TaxID=2829794 RepID=UPI001E4EF93D|nr:DUF927 domain-containing protein [Novosphingobium sp. CECT 9465]CAH0497221.1 hypothetical protein NVSP9465_02273 [Novosphingobium sp. CECT 9465]